jgi:hypothetical protein
MDISLGTGRIPGADLERCTLTKAGHPISIELPLGEECTSSPEESRGPLLPSLGSNKSSDEKQPERWSSVPKDFLTIPRIPSSVPKKIIPFFFPHSAREQWWVAYLCDRDRCRRLLWSIVGRETVWNMTVTAWARDGSIGRKILGGIRRALGDQKGFEEEGATEMSLGRGGVERSLKRLSR